MPLAGYKHIHTIDFVQSYSTAVASFSKHFSAVHSCLCLDSTYMRALLFVVVIFAISFSIYLFYLLLVVVAQITIAVC